MNGNCVREEKNLKKELEDCVKKLISYEIRALSADKEIRKNRINDYVAFLGDHFSNLDKENKIMYLESLGNLKLRVLRALTAINLKTDLPERFGAIKIDTLVDKDEPEPSDRSQIFMPAATSNQIPSVTIPRLNNTFYQANQSAD